MAPLARSTDSEFTQLIKGLQGERLRQAFRYFDKDGDGYIKPEEFQRIVLELAGHKLSDPVLERLPTLCTLSPGQKISYSEVIAFHNIIRGGSYVSEIRRIRARLNAILYALAEMDQVERIIRDATAKSKDGRITAADFLNEAAHSLRYGIFTPMEANIIWHFASRGSGDSSMRLANVDFDALLDPKVRLAAKDP
jgi:solute carrier family 25 aspartate/glutamate transporter 12/13